MPTGANRPGGSLRDVAAYLTGLRPVLVEALQGRQSWVRRIGVLLEDARHGNATLVAQAAGRVGKEQVSQFRQCRQQLERLHPPLECQECHAAMASWLDQLINVCEVLIGAGQTGDLRRLRETQEMLADSRTYARRFNSEYTRVVSDLRTRVVEAQRERARNERRRAANRGNGHRDGARR